MSTIVNLQDPVTLNTLGLGQNVMANSIPITLATDQPALQVFLNTSNTQTYGAAISNFTPAANATDIFEIDGPPVGSQFVVSLTQLMISATQTTSGWVNVSLIKRSSLNTGGTFTSTNGFMYIDGSSASVATLKGYTANPTLGTTVGTMMAFKMWVPATTVAGQPFVMTFGTRITQEIVLGIGESLCVNLGGHTVSGGSFTISAEWTEWY